MIGFPNGAYRFIHLLFYILFILFTGEKFNDTCTKICPTQ